MITLTPFGAAGEVTGSAYLVETEHARVLVDFGMFQGDKDDDARNIIPGHIHRHRLDAVLLTHAHLDHVGRLPLLTREGYRMPIYGTTASLDMLDIILRDSAHIQENDFERKRRRAERHGRKLPRTEQPMYDSEDVEEVIAQFRKVHYDAPVDVAKGIVAVFHEAGHMLGSASIELRIRDANTTRTIVFSGDLGPLGLPYLRDFEPPRHADVVVMESTYGDRNHKPLADSVEEFAAVIRKAADQKGRIFIPAFAIGRTQQILFHYAELVRAGRIPRIPVFVDSPMASKASRVYDGNTELFDQESTELMASHVLQRDLEGVTFTETIEESKAINDLQGPFIVIASSGMCNAGRIVHHLFNNVEKPDAHIVIAGFQSYGSLGRKLVDGVPQVMIHGELKQVRAQVHTISGLSAHAGQEDLLTWLSYLAPASPRVFLTHGEDGPRNSLASHMFNRFGIRPELPTFAQSLHLF